MKKKNKKNMILVIHHNDLDGVASALVLKQHLDKSYEHVKYVKWGYTMKKIDWDDVKDYKKIYILDIGKFPFTNVNGKIDVDIEWVDHHEHTHIEAKKIQSKDCNNMKLLLVPESPSNTILMYNRYGGKGVEDFVSLVDTYDGWQDSEKNFDDSLSLNIFAKVNKFEVDDLVDLLDNNKMWSAVKMGAKFKNFQMKQVKDGYFVITKRLVYKKKKIVFVDEAWEVNLISHYLLNNIADMIICKHYIKHKNKFRYNVRSNKLDCAKLAMLFGGGGHKKAAGFVIDKDYDDGIVDALKEVY